MENRKGQMGKIWSGDENRHKSSGSFREKKQLRSISCNFKIRREVKWRKKQKRL